MECSSCLSIMIVVACDMTAVLRRRKKPLEVVREEKNYRVEYSPFAEYAYCCDKFVSNTSYREHSDDMGWKESYTRNWLTTSLQRNTRRYGLRNPNQERKILLSSSRYQQRPSTETTYRRAQIVTQSNLHSIAKVRWG